MINHSSVDSHGKSNSGHFENFELVPFSNRVCPALSDSGTK